MSQFEHNVYCFISGKNWKLSLAELISYFDARNCPLEIWEFSRSFFTIKTQTPIEQSIIDELGGTLKIAEVASFVPTELITSGFQKENKQAKKHLKTLLPLGALAEKIPPASSGKLTFGVSVYWTDPAFRCIGTRAQRFLGSMLKEELKEQEKKARFMGFPADREKPQLTPVEVLKQGLLENHGEILFCMGKYETAIGTTIGVHNPFEFQKRDLDKPAQRKIFGISPRVAKIMVNLTRCTPGKVFLDPFCGVGTLLMEALLARAKVVGVDINRWCIESAKSNLNWLKHEYSLADADYVVLQGDVRKLSSKIGNDIDCIATEPDLGPALREIPTTQYAQKIIENLEPLFEDFLSESYEVMHPGAHLAVVTPFVKTRSGKPVTMNIQSIAQSIGFLPIKPFKQVIFKKAAADFPLKELSNFVDVDERHKIGREINVFMKPE
ncbi:MAG TPA: methyltransferase domain-containing protein [Candidatus Nanoarchaeia archaeon]|nr:methyltransferase domain-containing protein [Candidatus Nanoarchaeia archaeon]